MIYKKPKGFLTLNFNLQKNCKSTKLNNNK